MSFAKSDNPKLHPSSRLIAGNKQRFPLFSHLVNALSYAPLLLLIVQHKPYPLMSTRGDCDCNLIPPCIYSSRFDVILPLDFVADLFAMKANFFSNAI